MTVQRRYAASVLGTISHSASVEDRFLWPFVFFFFYLHCIVYCIILYCIALNFNDIIVEFLFLKVLIDDVRKISSCFSIQMPVHLAFSAFFQARFANQVAASLFGEPSTHHQLEKYGGVRHLNEHRVHRGGCVPAISKQGPCEFDQHSLVRKLVGALAEQRPHPQRQHDIFWSYRRSQQWEPFPSSHRKKSHQRWEP